MRCRSGCSPPRPNLAKWVIERQVFVEEDAAYPAWVINLMISGASGPIDIGHA